MIADIILVLFLLAFILWGSWRGLARMALSAGSFVISLIAGFVLYRPVSAFLSYMEIADGLAGRMKEGAVLDGLPGIMLDLPFTSSAADGIYQAVASAAVSVISFVSVVIIVKVVLFLVSAIVGLASNLPVIHQANGLAGGVIGFCLGIMFGLLIFAGLGVLEAFGKLNAMSGFLDGSYIASLIYNNNPLLGLIVN